MKITPEAKIQQEIYVDFNNKYCCKFHEPSLIIYSVTNGFGITLPENMPTVWKTFVRSEIAKINQLHQKIGMVSGISDLKIEGVNGRVISVEVKTEVGKQSPEQIKIQAKVQKLGGRYIVVRSLLDFQIQISSHINWLLGKV
jgi:hypothetical protein